MISLQTYTPERYEETVSLIRSFWKAHNDYLPTPEEAQEDLTAWTAEGLYLICRDGESVGFLHLGSRGAGMDWLEDLFVLPQYQRRGIGTQAIRLAEELVRTYSGSLFIEVAARNDAALRLYRRLGYGCLNTVTVRKDFPPCSYAVKSRETVCGLDFEIRTDKQENEHP